MTGKAYANRKPKKDRPKGDFYGTPPSLVWELLRAEFLYNNTWRSNLCNVLEPFSGKGNIVKALTEMHVKKENITAFDLYYGKNKQDFLQYNKKHVTIISNSPFSEFDVMVMHSKKIAFKIYFIGKMNFWGAYKRNQKGVWKHLRKIYVFDRQVDYRTPYRKDGHFHVGNLVTGWFCWDMQYTGLPTIQVMEVNKYATLGAHPDSRKKKAEIQNNNTCTPLLAAIQASQK